VDALITCRVIDTIHAGAEDEAMQHE